MDAAQTPAPENPPAGLPVPETYRLRRGEAFYRWVAGRLRAEERRRVLDAGCGDGFGSAILATAGLEVVGVENEDALVREAFERWGSHVAFRWAPLPRIDEPQHSYDAVVAGGILEVLAEPVRLVEEAKRLLRPGGTFIVRTANRLTVSPGRTRPIDGTHTWEFTPDELYHLLHRRFPHVSVFGLWHGRRLRAVEAALGSSLQLVVDRIPVPDRAPWLRLAMSRLRARDFVVGPGDVRHCLDIVAVASVDS